MLTKMKWAAPLAVLALASSALIYGSIVGADVALASSGGDRGIEPHSANGVARAKISLQAADCLPAEEVATVAMVGTGEEELFPGDSTEIADPTCRRRCTRHMEATTTGGSTKVCYKWKWVCFYYG